MSVQRRRQKESKQDSWGLLADRTESRELHNKPNDLTPLMCENDYGSRSKTSKRDLARSRAHSATRERYPTTELAEVFVLSNLTVYRIIEHSVQDIETEFRTEATSIHGFSSPVFCYIGL